jgi:hypothetical protein
MGYQCLIGVKQVSISTVKQKHNVSHTGKNVNCHGVGKTLQTLRLATFQELDSLVLTVAIIFHNTGQFYAIIWGWGRVKKLILTLIIYNGF